MSRRSRVPDAVASSGVVKNEPSDDHVHVPPAPSSAALHHHADEEDDDDPIVRTIDVYLSPALSNTLHLLQFPIQPAASSNRKGAQNNTPLEAKFRPRHRMLELEYPIPPSAQAGHRQLPDKMCLSQRTHTSTAIDPVTHMALAKMNRSGTRLDVVPLRRSVLQMRPSFGHLHRDDEDDDDAAKAAAAPSTEEESRPTSRGARQRPIMFQKKETERSAAARRNSYAYQKASEEGEAWIELDVHGSGGDWSTLTKETMGRIKCPNREHELKLAADAPGTGGYVKGLNYLTGAAGEAFVEDLSDWAPSAANADADFVGGGADDVDVEGEAPASSSSSPIGITERATAELASKLAVLLQDGNGTMLPYAVLRSRFHPAKVSDEMLTAALSSCAVLVRGNFALKSTLAKFLASSAIGGGETKKRRVRELRDLILLLLNMHGMVQRERLVRAYAAKANAAGAGGYDAINADLITFVLKTVARPCDEGWVAKVDDDERFAANFPEVAACHGVYWMKKKEAMMDLIELCEGCE